MPTALDVIPPLISIGAAGLSFYYFWKTHTLSIYIEGQKFLIEICKQLTAEPLLWCVYDDDAGQQQLRQRFSNEVDDPKFQAKLLAFAHLHLNMFEIVLGEAPNPRAFGLKNPSQVWLDYFDDTLNRSSLIRKVLDESESKKIWSKVLIGQYELWKEEHKTVAA